MGLGKRPPKQSEQREVLSLRLDSLSQSLPAQIRLLKVDVEGFELDVLQGAKETLKKCAVLMIEFHDVKEATGQEKIDLLKNLGFVPFILQKDSRLSPLECSKGSLQSADLIFLNKNVHDLGKRSDLFC